jgi:Spy/CpxP family protein refolding chaperone
METIRRRMAITSLISIPAFLMILVFAADASAQPGAGMMMGPCGMCGQGQGMMMPIMGGEKDHGKNPSSMSLMKMLHKWGKLFFTQKDELGLTEEQLDEIESILMSHVKSAIRKKADLKILFIESQEALVKEEINLKAVEKKLKAMEALNTEMAMEGIRTLKKALAVLKPEQQKKIRRLFKNTCFMRGKTMGMMPGGMMGQGGMMGSGMMPGMMGHQGGGAPSSEAQSK